MSFLTEVSGPPITDVPPPGWIFDRIEEWAKSSPNKFAFATDHQNKVEEYRYADVIEQSDGIAAVLAGKSIRRGDRIGILMENVPQWVFVLLGAMRIGAVTVPLPTTLPEHSLRLLVEHAECKLIVAHEQNWEKGSQVAAGVRC